MATTIINLQGHTKPEAFAERMAHLFPKFEFTLEGTYLYMSPKEGQKIPLPEEINAKSHVRQQARWHTKPDSLLTARECLHSD